MAWVEVLLLVGLGVLAAMLHARLRLPLHLPGRHGIEWMALLVLGRAASGRRVAASFSALGAAAFSMLPFAGFGDPFMPLVYLAPGLMMDLTFYIWPKVQGNVPMLAALGGLAHATKPLIRWLTALSLGLPYGSLMSGLLYPLSTHILFGAAGGFLGAGIAWVVRRK